MLKIALLNYVVWRSDIEKILQVNIIKKVCRLDALNRLFKLNISFICTTKQFYKKWRSRQE
jgi:hypothetical protein